MSTSSKKSKDQSIVTESDAIKKPKPRKRKRKSSDGEEYMEILPENSEETDQKLKETAQKIKLDDQSMKKLLKKVVTNDHVLALVHLQEEEELQKEEENFKITRAKAKKLIEESPAKIPSTAPWNFDLQPIKQIPVKTTPEVTSLLAQELPDESDDEYHPTNDDIPSDDDHTIESCSDFDSLPHTPASEPPASPVSASKVDGFKVPLTPKQKEENATIAKRTRSKLCLSETPIETIEDSFVPPDELPPTTSGAGDDLWTDFLTQVLDPAPTPRNDNEDDEADPEYNYAADQEVSDDDETLEGSIMRITQSEINDLVKELFNDLPDHEMLTAATSPCVDGVADQNPPKVLLDKVKNIKTEENADSKDFNSNQNKRLKKLTAIAPTQTKLENPPEMKRSKHRFTHNARMLRRKVKQHQSEVTETEKQWSGANGRFRKIRSKGARMKETDRKALEKDANPSDADELDTPSDEDSITLNTEDESEKDPAKDKTKKGKTKSSKSRGAPPYIPIPWNQDMINAINSEAPMFLSKHPNLAKTFGQGMVPRSLRQIIKSVNANRDVRKMVENTLPDIPKDFQVDAIQLEIMKQQMRMHVQLCTISYMQIFPHPFLWQHAPKYKYLLEDLVDRGKDKEASHFKPINLQPSLELIKVWEDTLNTNTKEVRDMLLHTKKEVEQSTRYQVTHNKYNMKFPKLFMDTIAPSTGVVLYPFLLPPMPFRTDTTTRTAYFDSEDRLIALGLEQFYDYMKKNPEIFRWKREKSLRAVVRLINQYMLPMINCGRLANHISIFKNKITNMYNPIKAYFDTNKVEPVKHELITFNETFTLFDHDPVHMPLQWVQYMKKGGYKAKLQANYFARVGGLKPGGIPVTSLTGQSLTLTPKNPINHFTPKTTPQILPPITIQMPPSSRPEPNFLNPMRVRAHDKLGQFLKIDDFTPFIVVRETDAHLFECEDDQKNETLLENSANSTVLESNESKVNKQEQHQESRVLDRRKKKIPRKCTCKIQSQLRKACKIQTQKTIDDFFNPKPVVKYLKCMKRLGKKFKSKFQILREMCNIEGDYVSVWSKCLDHMQGCIRGSRRKLKDVSWNVSDDFDVKERSQVLSLLQKIFSKSELEPRIPTLWSQFVHMVKSCEDPAYFLIGARSLLAGTHLQDELLDYVTLEQAIAAGFYGEYFAKYFYEDIVKAIFKIKSHTVRLKGLELLARSLGRTPDDDDLTTTALIYRGLVEFLMPFAVKHCDVAAALIPALPHIYVDFKRSENLEEEPEVPLDETQLNPNEADLVAETKGIQNLMPVPEPSSVTGSVEEENYFVSMPLLETPAKIQSESDRSTPASIHSNHPSPPMVLLPDSMTLDNHRLILVSNPETNNTVLMKVEIFDDENCPEEGEKLSPENVVIFEHPTAPLNRIHWSREDDRIILEVVKEYIASKSIDILAILGGDKSSEVLYAELMKHFSDRDKVDIRNRIVILMQYLLSDEVVKKEGV